MQNETDFHLRKSYDGRKETPGSENENSCLRNSMQWFQVIITNVESFWWALKYRMQETVKPEATFNNVIITPTYVQSTVCKKSAQNCFLKRLEELYSHVRT